MMRSFEVNEDSVSVQGPNGVVVIGFDDLGTINGFVARVVKGRENTAAEPKGSA